MSDGKTLDVIGTIKDGIGIGVKNIGPIIVNIILGALTCWIPYFGIGVLIGLTVGIPAKASKGEAIPMTEVFDPKYRKYMGEFFLTFGLMAAGIGAGFACFFIPGYVLALAWSLALLIAIDKGKNPTEAISLSNKCTYGSKFKIVLINAIVMIAVGILAAIFIKIPAVGWLFVLALLLFAGFVNVGIQASIYKQLTQGV